VPPNNSIDLLEQPGHVLADALHGAYDVRVPLDLASGPPEVSLARKALKGKDETDISPRPLDPPDWTSYNRR
jgi:hypothetical protein